MAVGEPGPLPGLPVGEENCFLGVVGITTSFQLYHRSPASSTQELTFWYDLLAGADGVSIFKMMFAFGFAIAASWVWRGIFLPSQESAPQQRQLPPPRPSVEESSGGSPQPSTLSPLHQPPHPHTIPRRSNKFETNTPKHTVES
jgi:hypothetical protein